MERKKRTRKASIRLKNCIVLVDNVMKRVKTTSGLESGAINRYMTAECLVEELLFGMPSDDNPEPGELLEAEETVSTDLDADDRTDHPEEQGHVRTDEEGVNGIITNKNSRNMNEKAEDTDNCSLDSDDYLQQPAETQPRVMKKRTRTTKSSPKIILPQDWREKPRSQLREELLGQDLDVDIGSSEDELQTEQQPSLIPTPFSLRHSQVMKNHEEIPETNQAISSTGFNDDDIEDIMVNIEENCEKNEKLKKSKKSKKTKKTKKNRKESTMKEKKKHKDEMKKGKKKKKSKERKEKGDEIILTESWQKKTREELCKEVLSDYSVPSVAMNQDEEDNWSFPARKYYVPLNSSSDLSLSDSELHYKEVAFM